MILSQDLIKYYQYFYKKKYKNEKYEFKPSDKTIKQLDKYLISLKKNYNLQSLGENFLWNYFIFQFNYWEGCDIASFSKRIVPSYIIGDKAIERWLERDQQYDWLFDKCEFISNYGLSKNDLKIAKIHIYKGNHEINIKLKYFNTTNGFDLCLTMTTLFNDKHLCCLECKFKKQCKEILKENYPKIYDKRGYNKNDNIGSKTNQ